MATIIFKKSIGTADRQITAVSLRTRDQARTVARRCREGGVICNTPVKSADGWHVTVKHDGGTLSRGANR